MNSIGLFAQLACIWEATARKPGNVHRYAEFEDAGYVDFLLSAAAAAPVLERAPGHCVGETVLEGVQATRRVAATNTNLGILLLLAPLAAVPPGEDLARGVEAVLDRLDVEDARLVYQAIRLASPAGLGWVQDQDVSEEPTRTLREVMALAADRDLVARQYAAGFREVLGEGVGAINRGLSEAGSLEEVVVLCHLRLMAGHPDSLIARKRGRAEAEESGRRAAGVLGAGWPRGQAGWAALADLDAWLRAEGHGRNPGATADLVAASLFAALRGGIMTLPAPLPWSRAWGGG